jgi:hypothetical protein
MDERDYRAMNAELKNQTAVEWLFNNLYNKDTINDCTLRAFEQAKEMEKQQIIDCSIETTQSCWKSLMENLKKELNFTEEDLQNQKDEAEQYYQETYKK